MAAFRTSCWPRGELYSLSAPLCRPRCAAFSGNNPHHAQTCRSQHLPRHQLATGLLKRRGSAVAVKGSPNSADIGKLKEFASTQLFRIWIQGAVFLVVLAAVDAAFSGDWSRIGVISKSTEQGLQPLVVGLGVFHIACATVAARSAASKNLSVAPAVLKVLAVGFLAMVEVLLADPQPEQ